VTAEPMRSRSSISAPARRAGRFAVFQHLSAIDEDMFDPDCELMRVFKSGAIGDRVGVEDNHVGKHPCFEKAAMIQAEIGRGQARKSPHRFGQRDYLLFAHVLAEQALRKRADQHQGRA